ncbi:hypothetical protein RFI_17718, partial [Reticulomyxa filosa]
NGDDENDHGLLQVAETLATHKQKKTGGRASKSAKEHKAGDDGFYYSSVEDLPSMFDLFEGGQTEKTTESQHSTKKSTNQDMIGWHLSLRPSLFNEQLRIEDISVGYPLLATVTGIQDHGYTIDVGNNEIIGFMNFDDAYWTTLLRFQQQDQSHDENEYLPVGATIEVVVKRINKQTNSLWATMKRETCELPLKDLPRVPIVALKPGFLVDCFVKTVKYKIY